jgi:hypothetical protein
MADVYEFHVTGLIGPVVRSALPELTTGAGDRNSVLCGKADGPDDVDRVLRQLGDAGLTPSHIVISSGRRWHDPGSSEPDDAERHGSGCAVPVVDDNGSQHDVLE